MLTKPFIRPYPNHLWYTTNHTPPLFFDYAQDTVGLTIIFSVLDSIPTGCVITTQSQKLWTTCSEFHEARDLLRIS